MFPATLRGTEYAEGEDAGGEGDVGVGAEFSRGWG